MKMNYPMSRSLALTKNPVGFYECKNHLGFSSFLVWVLCIPASG